PVAASRWRFDSGIVVEEVVPDAPPLPGVVRDVMQRPLARAAGDEGGGDAPEAEAGEEPEPEGQRADDADAEGEADGVAPPEEAAEVPDGAVHVVAAPGEGLVEPHRIVEPVEGACEEAEGRRY